MCQDSYERFKLKAEDAGNREGKHEGTDAKRCFVIVDEDYDDDDDELFIKREVTTYKLLLDF